MIKRLSQAIANGSITQQQLHEAALAAAGASAKELNAYTSLAPAGAADAGVAAAGGELRGLPVAVKDNFCTRDLPSTCGSATLQDFAPTYSATAVRRLQEQGCTVLGKTNMDPFGMGSGGVDGVLGPVRNPWTAFSDLAGAGGGDSANFYVAGGSSGGSAAAVAAGHVVGALASDTGGSVRIPAAFCGIVGLKPTYGLVSRHGLVPLVNALDCVSVMANSVNDAVSLLNAVQGPDSQDSTCLPSPPTPITIDSASSISQLRIGIPEQFHVPGLSASALAAWQRSAEHLADIAHSCKRVSLPHTALATKCYSVLCCAEVASNMSRYDGVEFGLRLRDQSAEVTASTDAMYAANRRAGFSHVIRSRVLAGNFYLLRQNYHKYFIQARKVWRMIKEDYDRVFNSVDILLCPSTVTSAWPFNDFVLADSRYRSSTMDACTQSVNLAGLPAISLPVQLEPGTNLPVAVQLIGPALSEAKLMTVAAAVEQFADFPYLADRCSPLLALLK